MKDKRMAYVNGGSLKLVGNECSTLQECLDRVVENNGKKGIYYYDKNGNMEFCTYTEIHDNATNILYGLQEKGCKYKEMIILQCSNAKDFVESFWACMYGGYIPLLANLPKSLEDLTATDSLTLNNIWKESKKPAILVSDECFNEYKLFSEKMKMKDVYLINIKQAKAQHRIGKKVKVLPTDIALMFFTSGSTGMPKGVIQTNSAAIKTVYGQIQFNRTVGENLLNWMPLEHAGGILMSHLRGIIKENNQIQVATEYILEDPLRWIDLMNQYRVSYSWAPHFAYVLIKDLVGKRKYDWDLSCVESLIDGGEMIHSKSAKDFLNKLKPYKLSSKVLHPTWGMCETCSGTIYNQDFDNNPLSGVQLLSKKDRKIVCNGKIEESDVVTEIGVPIPGCEIKIVDENNNLLEEDTIGRFLIKGDSITQGYYENSTANQESYTNDGWFITGDIGFIHNGKMTITGREKDIIIVNGMNYNNVEIEAIIEENVNVIKSFTAICSVIDPTTQKDIIIAFYVPSNSDDIQKLNDKIKQVVFEKMNVKISHTIPVNKEDIPKTNLGKIQRKKLAKNFQEKKYPIDENTIEVVNGKLLDTEDDIKEKLNIKDIAIFANDNKDLDYIHLSRFGFTDTNSTCKCMNNADIHSIEMILHNIKGIKELIVKYDPDTGKTFIFYNPCIKALEFNSFVISKMIEVLKNKFDYQYIIIPVLNQDISITDTNELIKEYFQGRYDELLEKLDLLLKNFRVIPQWFYKETIEKNETPILREERDSLKLVVCNDIPLISMLNSQLKQNLIFLVSSERKQDKENNKENIHYINFLDEDNIISILQQYKDKELDIIHLVGCDQYNVKDYNSLKKSQYDTVVGINNILHCLKRLNIEKYNFVVITKDVLYLENNKNLNYAISTMSGYIKAAADEGYHIKHVDLDSESLEKELLNIIYKEILIQSDIQIIYRKGIRYRILLQKIQASQITKNSDPLVYEGTYVVTGGMGGIALEIVDVLLERYEASVLLLGRSKLTSIQEEKYTNMIKRYGEKVEYRQCDVSDYKSERLIIDGFKRRKNRKLDGIIHLAGIFREKLIKDQFSDDIIETYNAKVFATYVQAKLVEENPGAIFITTSSVRTIIPGATVSAYCSASEFNEHIVGYLNHNKNIKAYCISWSQWSNTGMNSNSSMEEYLEEKGFKKIDSNSGKNSFMASLRYDERVVFVGLDSSKKSIRKLFYSQDDRLRLEIFVNYEDVKCEEEFTNKIKNIIRTHLGELSDCSINIHYLIDVPKDKNGEINKMVLQNRIGYIKKNKNITLPENVVEEKIYNCWKEIFSTIEFGTTDKFFELGGDSILLLKLVALLKKVFGIEIKTQTIFRLNTIKQQADYIESCIKNSKQKEDKTKNEKDVIDSIKGYQLSDEEMLEWRIERDNLDLSNNVGLTVWFDKKTVLPCVKMAIFSLVENYDLLRTRYIEKDRTVMGVLEENEKEFVIDEVTFDVTSTQDEINEFCKEKLEYKFDLSDSKKVIAHIIKCSNDSQFLLLVFSRMIMNEHKVLVFADELKSMYLAIMKEGYINKENEIYNRRHENQKNQNLLVYNSSSIKFNKKCSYNCSLSPEMGEKIKKVCRQYKCSEGILIFTYIIYKLFNMSEYAKKVKALVFSESDIQGKYLEIFGSYKKDFQGVLSNCLNAFKEKFTQSYADYDVMYIYKEIVDMQSDVEWKTEISTGKESYGHLNIFVLDILGSLNIKMEFDEKMWTYNEIEALFNSFKQLL